ncbi:MAG: hypothetical protein ACTTKQ_00270 [Filifactor alocis]|uniref:hypothetical protein n=1 Tax=Filifactor alocis TaxID=143361 RepID=UPI003F9F2ED1
MNLERYDDGQKSVIKKYFEVLADTRLTGKISEGIKNREVKYWERFSVPVVIQALSIHIQKYPSMRESYTRGIMRNLEAQGYQGQVNQTINKRKDFETAQDMSPNRRKEYEEEMKLFYRKKGVKLK